MKTTQPHFSGSHPVAALLIPVLYLTSFVFADGPSQCFNLDGFANKAHSPCVPASARNSATHSACCDLGAGQFCTTDGLCLALPQSTTVQAFLFQSGCTDSSLQDATCRTFCAPPGNGVKIMNVTPCPNSQWCCSPGYTSGCCSNSSAGFKFTFNMLLPTWSTTITAASCPATATATSTGSLTPQSTFLPPACSSKISGFSTAEDCPKDKTTIVGASVGAVLGAALLAALAAIFFMYRKLGSARRRYEAFEGGAAGRKTEGNPAGGVYQTGGTQRYEMPVGSIKMNNE